MNKDKSFSELMTKPDEEEQADVWFRLMDLAKELEDEHGYSRQTILEGLLEGILDLAMKRYDQRLFQKMNDIRRFYLYASEVTKRRYDTFPNYADQRFVEEKFGKDMPFIRDAKNFGWESDDSEPEENAEQ
ncbi:MAG: hypothetical protein KDE33_20240 [Bacteroidetes bacterium]|nr:hypothetical protein [Bacteroidota bacterium]